MLNFTGSLKVFLALGATDLRRSFDGLYAQASEVMKERPESGALFVFSNARRNRIKILYFDGTGLWVMAKRLEQGTFFWPPAAEADAKKLEIKPEALSMLLDGVDLKRGSLRPWFQR